MLTVDYSRLPLSPGCRFLDVGCGEGRHTAEAYLRPGVFAVATDLDPANVEKTRGFLLAMKEQGMGRGMGFGALVSDCTSLPFASESFEAVICAEVMEHVPDKRAAARELIRVLKPGGVLSVTVPRYFPERICWALSRQYHENPGGHIRIYTKGSIIRLMEEAGAVLLSRHYAHALHSPYWWLKCACGVNNVDALPVRLYHRFLVWDIMAKPRSVRLLERALNPVLGKSLVCYFRK